MRIAVAHKDGNVFEHFGHTEEFKIYTVEGDEILSTEIIKAGETGHSALASLLADNSVNVLICGGIGTGARMALDEQGIELCAGQEGNADVLVQLYLIGGLENSGENCNHHGNCGENGCGDGGCGSEGGCGGCHSKPSISGKKVGNTSSIKMPRETKNNI